jgi:hypothetical protein
MATKKKPSKKSLQKSTPATQKSIGKSVVKSEPSTEVSASVKADLKKLISTYPGAVELELRQRFHHFEDFTEAGALERIIATARNYGDVAAQTRFINELIERVRWEAVSNMVKDHPDAADKILLSKVEKYKPSNEIARFNGLSTLVKTYPSTADGYDGFYGELLNEIE